MSRLHTWLLLMLMTLTSLELFSNENLVAIKLEDTFADSVFKQYIEALMLSWYDLDDYQGYEDAQALDRFVIYPIMGRFYFCLNNFDHLKNERPSRENMAYLFRLTDQVIQKALIFCEQNSKLQVKTFKMLIMKLEKRSMLFIENP